MFDKKGSMEEREQERKKGRKKVSKKEIKKKVSKKERKCTIYTAVCTLYYYHSFKMGLFRIKLIPIVAF